MIDLRDYQQALVDGGSASYATGARRVLLCLPTGGGKGRILGSVCCRAAARMKRVMIVAHRAELVEQICNNLDDEGVDYGRVQPGWPSMLHRTVHVGMVQTVARRLDRLVSPDLLLIDEAHHSPAGQYRALTNAWPKARVCGVTATPIRTDGRGLDDDFDALVCGPGMAELIERGFLADYDYYEPSPDFDAVGIGVQAGEFKSAAALAALSKAKVVGDAVQHYRKLLAGRSAIAFCMGFDHTHAVAREFSAAGIRSVGVDGKMPMELRQERIRGLANGTVDVLTAADVISEGVDIPTVGGALLLRPTCSPALHLQQVGRALRKKPDGSKAVILDHVGNAKRHGYPADPRTWSLTGMAPRDVLPTRSCRTCFRVVAAATQIKAIIAECEQEACGMQSAPVEIGRKEEIAVIPGELEQARDPWAWARGCDPVLARGQEFAALVDHAQTEEQLRMIARARGFKRGWIQHILRSRTVSVAA